MVCTQDAGACDHICGFPCAADGSGHRRLDEEPGGLTALRSKVSTNSCEWDDFDNDIRAATAACCGDDTNGCVGGFPESCSYDCGMAYVPLFEACGDIMLSLLDDETDSQIVGFNALSEKCLQVRPTTTSHFHAHRTRIDRTCCDEIANLNGVRTNCSWTQSL